MQRLKQLISHPLTAGALGLSAVGQLGFGLFEPLWSLVSTTSGMWFPAVAVTAGTIAPEIGFADLGTKVLLAAAILFVGVQLDRLASRAKTWYNER
ncbi:hypothetical protein [Haloarcula marina]|uniref:hypothetical protein n=1 Tax=Haloarcula marina TaxID=2961574 RepID=UPI0020B75564|nr:hypothetical protein [Halomicroarcula marina]